MKIQLKKTLRLILTIITVIAIWELTSINLNSYLIPSFFKIISSLYGALTSGELIDDLSISVFRIFVGFIIGSSFGIITGISTSRINFINDTVGQFLHFLRAIPIVALLPLVMIWFGIGEIAKIGLIAFTIFFPVWLNTHTGINHINNNYILAAKNVGASRLQIISHVLIPAAMQHILSGIRLGLGLGFIILVIAEMAGSYSGLGFRIEISHLLYRTDKMIGIIILLGCMGIFFDKLIVLIGKYLFPWIRDELK